jgi:hypothetical protein
MANKIKGKNRRALLQGMKSLGDELKTGNNQERKVTDREMLSNIRAAGIERVQTKWIYNPTDLVRVKHWQFGTFIATVISTEGPMATLLGPMGTVIVPCSSLQLIDRYEDACE